VIPALAATVNAAASNVRDRIKLPTRNMKIVIEDRRDT
jgi:hypothetical protein